MKQAYVMAAKCLYYSGREEEATHMLTRAISRDPSYVDANFWMGKVLLIRGELQKSEQYLLNVIGEDATHVDARLLLGDLYHRSGSLERAILNYSVVESNLDLVVLSKIKKAKIYIDSQEYERAMRELDIVRKIGGFIDSRILEEAHEQLARIPLGESMR
jgi:tetratricopeptide (TPR) repeat protein